MSPFFIRLECKATELLYKYRFSLHISQYQLAIKPLKCHSPLHLAPWSLLLSLHSSCYPWSSSTQLHKQYTHWHVGPRSWHHALLQYYTRRLLPVHAAPNSGSKDHAFVSTKKTPLSKAMSILRIARRLALLVGSLLLPVEYWFYVVENGVSLDEPFLYICIFCCYNR
jgi:hypothetical protein